MSTFSNLDATQSRIPPGHVVVPRFAFSTEWLRRLPKHLQVDEKGAAVGLRLVADGDLLTARVQAAQQALEIHPRAGTERTEHAEWNATRVQIAIRHVVGFGTCDPNDYAQPCPYWAADPVEEVRYALTDAGMGLIFDAWEKLRVTLDPLVPRLEDHEVARLVERLTDGALGGLDVAKATRVRKFLSFCLDELETTPGGASFVARG